MTTQSSNANLTGSLWMVAAMLGFAIEDSFFKASTATLPISQAIVLMGGIGALIFSLLARRTDQSLFVPEITSRPMLIRAVFEITGRLFFFLAIALAPLSSATVILQATPIVVVAGAALFLGDKVGWRRWAAIALGLTGVLIVLNPSGQSFTWYSGFAVLGMLGFAGRDLASRAAPATLTTSVLGFYGFLAIIVAGLFYRVWSGVPFETVTFENGSQIALAAVFGVFGYSSLMKAMRTGEISAVAPFRYSRLLIGLAIGVLWFGEDLTLRMLTGSAIIILAGLFLLWRGRSK
ncbi:DMT family transporter [Cognatishimia maritima]|uniref:EamA-like transporter family protein n=1 Tax=Cognatishimia maritima TaxID=870908 RepID=A0A1M5JFP6_9RHOB|nr:DMT family transporter [Cognatishimia maritima]SHG39109.1 EamA-like transporter family protein [Cognatishimia maritima]